MRPAPVLLGMLLLAPVPSGCLAPAPGPGDAGTGPEGADLVLLGGRVWTGDAQGTIAQALAVHGDRVVRVGSDAEVRPLVGAASRVVDLAGALVLPGLYDQHAHALEVALGTSRGGANPFAPGFDPSPDPVQQELGRQAIGSYHVATKAAGKTPSHDWQRDPVTDCRPPSPVTPDLKDRIRFMQEEAAKQGLTTLVEAGLSDLGVWDALQEMERDGEMRVRVLVRIAWGCVEEAQARGIGQGDGGDWARILGVKLYSDGWLGPRTTALRAPYNDRPLSQGILFLEPAQWVREVARAKELGYNIGTHTIGDRAMQVILDAYEANGVGPGDRWSLEHVQVLAPDLLDRMVALGVIGSMQTSFATSDMGFAESALGPQRARWAYAWNSSLQRGVRLAGGSDFPIEVLNPFWGLQRVVTRQELHGQPAGGWHPEERLSLPTALRLVTRDAAYASLEDDERGSLEAGKRADLVVVREDLLAGSPDRIASATVLLTVANGVVTFEGAQSYAPRSLAASAEARAALPASTATKGSTPIAMPASMGT